MSNNSADNGWRLLDPDEAAALRGVAETPGWVATESVETAVALTRRIQALRREVAELDAVVLAAREQGRQAGLRDGAGNVQELVAAVRSFREALVDRSAVVAVALAEALLHAEVSAEPSVLLPRIRAMLSEQTSPPIRVRLAPIVAARVASELDPLVAVVSDASLQPADAVIELPNGQIDARVHVALALLAPSVRDSLSEVAADPEGDDLG